MRSNRTIRGLEELPPDASFDVDIRLESRLERRAPHPHGLPELLPAWAIDEPARSRSGPRSELTENGSHYRIRFADGTAFLVSRNGRGVYGSWPDGLTLEDALTYLLGPIFGLVLRLRGIIGLHASAISVGNHAIALVGQAEAGKSTTAAAFAKMGVPILSDDLVTVWPQADAFVVQPGYRYVRLWPDSAEILFGAAHGLPLLTPTWDKRYLPLTGQEYRFESRSLPLTALYFLQPRSLDDAPSVGPIGGSWPFLSLVTEANGSLIRDSMAGAAEFEIIAKVMQRVPCRGATPHADPARLPELCDLILEDYRAISLETASVAA